MRLFIILALIAYICDALINSEMNVLLWGTLSKVIYCSGACSTGVLIVVAKIVGDA